LYARSTEQFGLSTEQNTFLSTEDNVKGYTGTVYSNTTRMKWRITNIMQIKQYIVWTSVKRVEGFQDWQDWALDT